MTRGALFNAGLEYLLEGAGLGGLGRYDCVVLHAVDLLPSASVRGDRAWCVKVETDIGEAGGITVK